ncbi:MAG: hypothetical protein IKY18_03615 [Oscillospiraceae bacterium]|nr:hypothetical protein [Oscillospiraceae bacterium]
MNYFESRSDYGQYRTQTFSDHFPDFETWQTKIGGMLTIPYLDATLHPGIPSPETIYTLLMAEYKNSHVLSSDPTRFVLKCAALMYQYAPEYQREMEIQDKLRNMTQDELMSGAEIIANEAMHPAKTVDVSAHEKITTINGQRTSWTQKDKATAYAELYALLDADITTRFVARFRRLFLVNVTPNEPLFYPEIETET